MAEATQLRMPPPTSRPYWAWRLDPKQPVAAGLAHAAEYRRQVYGEAVTGALVGPAVAASIPDDFALFPYTIDPAVPAGTAYFTLEERQA